MTVAYQRARADHKIIDGGFYAPKIQYAACRGRSRGIVLRDSLYAEPVTQITPT